MGRINCKPLQSLCNKQRLKRLTIMKSLNLSRRIAQTSFRKKSDIVHTDTAINNLPLENDSLPPIDSNMDCDGESTPSISNVAVNHILDLNITSPDKTTTNPPSTSMCDRSNAIRSYTENFENLFRQCCLDMNINHKQTTALLKVLRTHMCFKNLPKDSRTLLQTGRNKVNFVHMDGGIYWHVGFVRPIREHLLLCEKIPMTLELELSSDGLSLTRNDPNQYWPIQCRVTNITRFKPLIIGIYKGPHKPSNAETFFQSFLDEVEEAEKLGGIRVRDKIIPFTFTNFIGDAPARALILNHYGHNSRHPCSKCHVVGFKYNNRNMVYLGTDHPKRNDRSYASGEYEDHQKGPSPLPGLGILPVSRVPFDIMHLVYLGVTLRILEAWIDRKFDDRVALSKNCIQELSSRFLKLKNTCPQEFARRPRTLTKFHKFKATELRHFLLYAAPVILCGILSSELYIHFLYFHIAMRILTSPKHKIKDLNIAEASLKCFVKYSSDFYTPAFVSYNVHALLHLADDARVCGPLENCSAFVYENNMPLFKKNIRNHPRPLEQFANRLHEKNHIQHYPKKPFNSIHEEVSAKHHSNIIPTGLKQADFVQFKKYESEKFKFSLDDCNSYCKLEDESVCRIVNILSNNGKIFAVIRKFNEVTDFYSEPISSSDIGVHRCRYLSNNLQLIVMNNIVAKCYCMPSWDASHAVDSGSSITGEECIITTLLHHQ